MFAVSTVKLGRALDIRYDKPVKEHLLGRLKESIGCQKLVMPVPSLIQCRLQECTSEGAMHRSRGC